MNTLTYILNIERTWLGMVFVTSLCLGNMNGQTVIDLDEPRVLSKAIVKLQELAPLQAHYEEYPYANALDLQDRTLESTSVQQRMQNPGFRLIVPTSLKLRVTIPTMDSKNLSNSFSTALNELCGAMNSANKSAKFETVSIGDQFLVKPSYYLNNAGNLTTYKSILDLPVTLSVGKDLPIRVLDSILNQVGAQLKLSVKSMNFPLMLFGQERNVGINGTMSARNAILLLFRQLALPVTEGGAGVRLNYHLYYDPGINWWGLSVLPLKSIEISNGFQPPSIPRSDPTSRFGARQP